MAEVGKKERQTDLETFYVLVVADAEISIQTITHDPLHQSKLISGERNSDKAFTLMAICHDKDTRNNLLRVYEIW